MPPRVYRGYGRAAVPARQRRVRPLAETIQQVKGTEAQGIVERICELNPFRLNMQKAESVYGALKQQFGIPLLEAGKALDSAGIKDPREVVWSCRKQRLEETLLETPRIAEAARRLGISVRTLQQNCTRLGMRASRARIEERKKEPDSTGGAVVGGKQCMPMIREYWELLPEDAQDWAKNEIMEALRSMDPWDTWIWTQQAIYREIGRKYGVDENEIVRNAWAMGIDVWRLRDAQRAAMIRHALRISKDPWDAAERLGMQGEGGLTRFREEAKRMGVRLAKHLGEREEVAAWDSARLEQALRWVNPTNGTPSSEHAIAVMVQQYGVEADALALQFTKRRIDLQERLMQRSSRWTGRKTGLEESATDPLAGWDKGRLVRELLGSGVQPFKLDLNKKAGRTQALASAMGVDGEELAGWMTAHKTTIRELTKELRRTVLEKVLRASRTQAEAARALGMRHNTFSAHLRELGVSKEMLGKEVK